MIDCERQLQRVRTPSEGKIVIYDESIQGEQTICSTVRARRYLQQGCSRFLAYIMDTRVMRKITIAYVPLVRDFPNLFPMDYGECLLRSMLSSGLI